MTLIINGDCLEELRAMPDNSVDAVITDPPYGLSNTTPTQVAETIAAWVTGDREHVPSTSGGFMGAAWDSFVPPPAVWDECLRVLKPGGHMAVFAGTRTQDIMGIGIRLAGFDIRDSIAWISGQGFPKSQNVGKSPVFCQCKEVESKHGNGELLGMRKGIRDACGMVEEGKESDVLQAVQRRCEGQGLGDARSQGCDRKEDVYTHVRGGQPCMEGRRDVQAPEGELCGGSLREVPAGVADDGAEGRVRRGAPSGDGSADRATANPDGSGEPQESRSAGQQAGEPGTVSHERGSQTRGVRPICGGCGKPVRPEGFGTALKPSHEPVIIARKPLSERTVAANVLTWGTGAINVDATRIQGKPRTTHAGGNKVGNRAGASSYVVGEEGHTYEGAQGRFPANVVLDRANADRLDRQSGYQRDGVSVNRNRNGDEIANEIYGARRKDTKDAGYGGGGGASRFFHVAENLDQLDAPFKYCAKAPKKERPSYVDEDGATVQHSTVKPLSIMSWLVRLLTPPGGVVLDPFAGSGTTVEAALLEGMNPIGIEAHTPYIPLIHQRVARATATEDTLPIGDAA